MKPTTVTKTKAALLLFTLSISAPTFAKPSMCVSVYKDATRSYSMTEKQSVELDYFYDLYCEESGEMRDEAGSLGLDIVVKAIPIKFSGSSNSAEQKMKEFCKTHSEKRFVSQVNNKYENSVVVDALRSFNQCVALETRGLIISHSDQHPSGVTFFGEYKDRTTEATLDAVTYDENLITCTSTNLNEDGKVIVVNDQQRHDIPENFNISCTRKADTSDSGIAYQRTTVGLSTSLGMYSVVLQPDTLQGYTLASSARAAVTRANNAKQEAQEKAKKSEVEAAAAIKRLHASTVVGWHTFSLGEYDRGAIFRPRYYCYHDIHAEARALCGSDIPQINMVRIASGDKCGYLDYVVACLRK